MEENKQKRGKITDMLKIKESIFENMQKIFKKTMIDTKTFPKSYAILEKKLKIKTEREKKMILLGYLFGRMIADNQRSYQLGQGLEYLASLLGGLSGQNQEGEGSGKSPVDNTEQYIG